jgi:hypothetical protein
MTRGRRITALARRTYRAQRSRTCSQTTAGGEFPRFELETTGMNRGAQAGVPITLWVALLDRLRFGLERVRGEIDIVLA